MTKAKRKRTESIHIWCTLEEKEAIKKYFGRYSKIRDLALSRIANREEEKDLWEPGENEKRCSVCGIIKPLSEFHKHWVSPKGRSPMCKSCRKEYNHEQYEKHKNYHKDYYKSKVKPEYLQKYWGLSMMEYLDISVKQNNRCPVCGCHIDATENNSVRLNDMNGELKLLCTKCHLESIGKQYFMEDK